MKKEKTLLLTGFEPFGSESVNPSQMLLEDMPEAIGSLKIIRVLLPVSFEKARTLLEKTLEAQKPDALLCMGQAAGRTCLSLEKSAVNWMDASIPDNDGMQPKGKSIMANKPDGLFASLPLASMIDACKKAGIPAALSLSAGTYVCNTVMYTALTWARRQKKQPVPAGFLHLPLLVQQAARQNNPAPSMSLADMKTGLCAMLSALSKAMETESKAHLKQSESD